MMIEAALAFFYHIAKTIGQEFEQIFGKIIEIVLKIVQEDKGVEYVKPQDDELQFGEDSEEDDEDMVKGILNNNNKIN